MFKKKFLENFSLKSKNFNRNSKKTRKIFNSLNLNSNENEISLLNSYSNEYNLAFSQETIKKYKKFSNIIIVGIGGSILGTKCIYSFFKKKIKKNVFFFDNLDLNLFLKFKKIKNLKDSCFVIISKSGNTLETIVNLKNIFSKTLMKNKLVIITELKDSKLLEIGSNFNAEIVEHKKFIGGRYSVLSEVGMLPATLMNLNINKFKNFDKLVKNNLFTSSLIKSASSIYTLSQKGFKNSVILNYDSDLNDLCLWHQQLVAESLGKKGKGIMPVISTCPKDNHSLLQLYLDGPKDKFFTFFSSKNKNKTETIINAQCEATKNIFKNKKIPFRHFIFEKNDEKELGITFTFFVLETILLASLLNVNPFDQPAVEEVKIETKKILKSKIGNLTKNYF